jgi:Protein of unknown function (DUF3429)
MSATPNSFRNAPLSSAAELACYLGVAPLALCLLGVGLLPEFGARELAQRVALAWGAVLLGACGAVHWGLALAGRLPWDTTRIAAAVLAAACAAAAAVLGGQHGLALLVVGFGGFWLYEHRVLGAALPPEWLALRRNLTLASCMLLALTMFASEGAGLR